MEKQRNHKRHFLDFKERSKAGLKVGKGDGEVMGNDLEICCALLGHRVEIVIQIWILQRVPVIQPPQNRNQTRISDGFGLCDVSTFLSSCGARYLPISFCQLTALTCLRVFNLFYVGFR